MTRDLEILYNESGQWNDTGRERFGNHWNRSGKARGRKRKQVIPACSADGDDR